MDAFVVICVENHEARRLLEGHVNWVTIISCFVVFPPAWQPTSRQPLPLMGSDGHQINIHMSEALITMQGPLTFAIIYRQHASGQPHPHM